MDRLAKGIHHVSLKPSDQETFDKAVALYRDMLGMEERHSGGGRVMLDTGAGCVEISVGEGSSSLGAVNHFAIATDFLDQIVEKVRAAGYKITVEPRGGGESKVRIAFFQGPCGELVELYQEKGL